VVAGNVCNISGICDVAPNGYAVALGLISLVVSIVMLVLYLFSNATATIIQPFVAAFLFLWWFCGVGVVTFLGPFNSPCGTSGSPNGFYGSWLAMVSSTLLLMEVPQIRDAAAKVCSITAPDSTMLGFLALSSSLCWIQGAYDCDKDAYAGCPDSMGWAIAGGLISVILSMVVCFVPPVHQNSLAKKIIYGILVLIWIFMIIPLTYSYETGKGGEYSMAGNGFFSCWVSFFVSVVLFAEAMLGINIFAAASAEDGGGSGGGDETPADVEVNKAAAPSAVDGTVTEADEAEEPKPDEEGAAV